MRSRALLLSVALLLLGCRAQPEPQPHSAVVDLDGRASDPLADARADLLLFLRTDCPISNRYAPTLRRIVEGLESKPVDVWLVYVDADETPELIRRHIAEYGLLGTPLRDPQQQLAVRAGIRVTPEAAVFDAERERVYRGRIDDWYVDYGKNRAEASTHELADALDALLAGRAPAVAEAQAVGCPIPPI